jgi:hypothetical protein
MRAVPSGSFQTSVDEAVLGAPSDSQTLPTTNAEQAGPGDFLDQFCTAPEVSERFDESSIQTRCIS